MSLAPAQSMITSTFERRWLESAALLALHGQDVAEVSVEAGEVWISFDGRDLVVPAGRSIPVASVDRVLIQNIAADPAQLLLRRPGRERQLSGHCLRASLERRAAPAQRRRGPAALTSGAGIC